MRWCTHHRNRKYTSDVPHTHEFPDMKNTKKKSVQCTHTNLLDLKERHPKSTYMHTHSYIAHLGIWECVYKVITQQHFNMPKPFRMCANEPRSLLSSNLALHLTIAFTDTMEGKVHTLTAVNVN